MMLYLQEFAPVIGDISVSDIILNRIMEHLRQLDAVSIDFSGIRVIATNCAKHIFGKLYLDMGGDEFFSKIEILNASDNVKASILNGIEAAVCDSQ